MSIDVVIWIAGAAIAIFVWVHMALTWGYVHSVDSDGFVLTTLLRSRYRIQWSSVIGPIRQFTGLLKRVTVNIRRRHLFQFRTSVAVLLKRDDIDDELLRAMRTRYQIVTVKNLRDFHW